MTPALAELLLIFAILLFAAWTFAKEHF